MKIAAIVGVVALLPGIVPVSGQPAPSQNACFFLHELRGWKAPDDRTIFIRVGAARFYRLDLAAACPLLTLPDSHLITRTRGPETVCSGIDWDLRVAQPPPLTTPQPCIVRTMTLLTPDEAAAIPPKFRPY